MVVTAGAPQTAVYGPCVVDEAFQVSVHTCPRSLYRELAQMFPDILKKKQEDMQHAVHAILTCQKAALDLSDFGDNADAEKDRLLDTFMAWAESLCKFIETQGFFVDYIDPCSGLPVRTVAF